MFGKKAKTVDPGIPEHIINRVQKLSEPDLVMWADQAIYTTGRYLTLYTKSNEEYALDEAATGSQVLMAIVNEMRFRDLGRR